MKDLLKGIIEDTEITNWHILALFITTEIVLMFTMNNYILSRDTFGLLFAGKYDIASIDNIYIISQKLSIWGYIFLPVILLLRVSLAALLLQFIFMIKLEEISFKKIFRVILLAYGILIISSIARLIILLFTPMNELSSNAISSVPLSLTILFSSNNISELVEAIISQFNLFEFVWILIVTIGIKLISSMKIEQASLITLSAWLIIFLLKAGVNTYLYNIIES